MICLDAERVGPWVAERVGGIWTGIHETAIGWEVQGQITAGCMFEKYIKDRSIVVHLAIERPPIRDFLLACFDYGFLQLNIRKAIAIVDSSNVQALALNRRLGYTVEGRIEDAAKGGDLIIMTFNRARYYALRAKYGREIRRTGCA